MVSIWDIKGKGITVSRVLGGITCGGKGQGSWLAITNAMPWKNVMA